MPRIVIQADQSDRYSEVVTLSERIISAHLQDCHYAARDPEPLARSRGIAKGDMR
jgi:hypothetical protein